MPTPKEYRHYAEVCKEFASTVGNKIERAMLLKIVEQWRRLANHKEKLVRAEQEHQYGKFLREWNLEGREA
jgi:hypothetical protein